MKGLAVDRFVDRRSLWANPVFPAALCGKTQAVKTAAAGRQQLVVAEWSLS
jgi:hypothetical protein